MFENALECPMGSSYVRYLAKLSKFFLWTILFLNNDALAQSALNVGGRFKEDRATLDRIFWNVPGVAANDLSFSPEIYSWNQFQMSSEQAKNQYKIELNILAQFNSEAKRVWDLLQDCYRGDNEKLRADYYHKKLRCSELEMKQFRINLKNWLATSVLGEDLSNMFDAKTMWNYLIYLPPLHPLLGQALVESLAFYKKRLSDVLKTRQHQLSVSEVFSHFYSCLENSNVDAKCERILSYAPQFLLVSNLFKAVKISCLSFGLWPNASYMLFAHWTMGTNEHPLNAPKDNEYLIDSFSAFGKSWTYEIYFRADDLTRSSIDTVSVGEYFLQLSLESKLSLQKGLKESMADDFSKKYEASSLLNLQPESCWQGQSEAQALAAKPRISTRPIREYSNRIYGFTQKYSELFQFYLEEK